MGSTTSTCADAVEQLSKRQREVLELIARGLTNKEVGGALGISGETVRTHLSAILERLDVTNRTEAAATWLSWVAGAERVAEVLRRPALAVLPVVAIDEDPRARTIAEGMTRDLVGLFARWCWFPVISHASSRDARALGRTSQDIGDRLGARFLVDGALRASQGAWRLAIEIVDAQTGHVIWVDATDFPREALFEAQDEVCGAVVAAAYPRLIATVATEMTRPPRPRDLQTWEMAHHAFILHDARECDANRRAQDALTAALEREPTLMLAHYVRGLASYDEILNQWGPARAAADRLRACAERCIDLAPHMAEGHYLLARHFQAIGAHDRAAAPLECAIGVNPSFASAHALLAQVHLLGGRTAEGLVRMQQACRLSPRAFVAGLAVAHYTRHEYAEALAAAERAIATNPRYPFAHALAAAAAWWLEDADRAAAHAGALRAIQPGFDPASFTTTFGSRIDAVASVERALRAIAARG